DRGHAGVRGCATCAPCFRLRAQWTPDGKRLAPASCPSRQAACRGGPQTLPPPVPLLPAGGNRCRKIRGHPQTVCGFRGTARPRRPAATPVGRGGAPRVPVLVVELSVPGAGGHRPGGLTALQTLSRLAGTSSVAAGGYEQPWGLSPRGVPTTS